MKGPVGSIPALAAEVSMAIPYRGITSSSTYFLTAGTYNKTHILQSERMSDLFCEVLFRYRDAGKFSLHAFVVMPNHIHLLLTVPEGLMLERTMQLIKGGFSYEAGKQFGMSGAIWQKSYMDRRVRDGVECGRFREYIHQNPVRAGLVGAAEQFVHSSANPAFMLDEVPQRLKPENLFNPRMHR
jgi:putative transposase